MKPRLPIPSGVLRPAEPGDADRLERLLHDPGVRRFLCDDTCLPRHVIEEMLERSDRLDPEGLGLWAIERDGSGFAGVVGLEPVSPATAALPRMHGGVEPIIAIAPRFEGLGLAAEALGAVMDHAGKTLRLERLVAAVDDPNVRSHRLMRRAGFIAVGRTAGPAHELVLYEHPFAPRTSEV